MLASSACRAPLWRAHLLNEEGIRRLSSGDHENAARRFERSAAFEVHEHVPTFNLGNTALDLGDLTAAHEAYERALLLEPDLTEAYYNDGHTLYLWGEREIDSTGCELERTRELWQQAARRFQRVQELAWPWSPMRAGAAANLDFIEQRLKELDELAEQCPESPGGGGGEGDSGGGGGGQEGPGGGGGSGEGGSSQPPPITQEERQTIARELERIRSESSAAKGYRQSHHMQLDPESAEGAGGERILW
jgi:tetratricopeptide (TPR) repeat protein